jgi:DNA-binding MurR/RpiR family transcriptional regulator
MKIAQLSINETFHASGVSAATANRFARKLGFDGYPQFRNEVINAFEEVLAPVERLRRRVSAGNTPSEIVASSIEEDMENLQTTLANLDMSRVTMLAERIVAARRVFVLGFDTSAALSTIFAYRLGAAGIDVRTNQNGGGRLATARELAQFGPEDIIVATAFPRYIRDTVEMARDAAARGLTVVAITDSQASPLTEFAEFSIYLPARRTISSTSDTAILCFLEALSAAVTALRPGSTEASEKCTEFTMHWMLSTTACGTMQEIGTVKRLRNRPIIGGRAYPPVTERGLPFWKNNSTKLPTKKLRKCGSRRSLPQRRTMQEEFRNWISPWSERISLPER